MTPFKWILLFFAVWLFFGLYGVAAVALGVWAHRRWYTPAPHVPNPARRRR